MKRRILFSILGLSMFLSLNAHTVWIESALIGKKGVVHRVELNFGEFSMEDKTPAQDWLEGLSDGVLQVMSPNGDLTDLHVEASDSCFAAVFTPDQEGWYRIHYDCLVEKAWHGTKLHYQSIAWVCVGTPKDAPIVDSPFKNGVVFLPSLSNNHKVGEKILYPVRKDKEIPKRIALNVLASNGSRKNYYRLEDGNLVVTPLWKGRFLVNFTEKNTFCPEESEKNGGLKGTYSTLTYFFDVR